MMQAAIWKITFLLLVLTVLQTDGWGSRRRRRSPPARDTEAPRVTSCPSNIQVNTAHGQSSAVVSYTSPRATDNVGITYGIIVLVYPGPGKRLTFGPHNIWYIFSDSSSTANCVCKVYLNPNDARYATHSCGSSIQLHPGSSTIGIGNYVRVITGAGSGTRLSIGTHKIWHIFSDAAGNSANCAFTITVNGRRKRDVLEIEGLNSKMIRCPPFPSPANEIIACYESSKGQVCTTTCVSGTQKMYGVPTAYVCTTNGTWTPAKINDCDPPIKTSNGGILVPNSHDADYCSSDDTQIAAEYLDKLMKTTFPELCSNDGCSLKNIEVTCGSPSTLM